jgi:hypothetical protein
MFDRALLQAISDWQKGGAHAKSARGRRLKKLCASLDGRFREAHQPCYRRIDLDNPGLQVLGETLRLPEAISAWTLAPEVAEGHNRGVPAPETNKIGIIVRILPDPIPIAAVVNLDALFGDSDFRAAEEALRDQVKQYDRGMGWYGNKQREVIIECDEVALTSVWAWGGKSSTKAELLEGMRAGLYGRKHATPEAIRAVSKGLAAQPQRLGPQWLKGPEAVARTRNSLAAHAKTRALRKRSERN